MGISEPVDDGDGAAAAPSVVVLVDGAGGGELAAVRDALTGPLATPAVFIGPADLGSLSVALELGTGLLDVGGRLVRPEVVWVRHASGCALVARAGSAGSMRPLKARAWSGFLKQLTDVGSVALPGTAPAGPEQLRDAARLGVRAPRTVLTTDVAAGARRMRTRRIVVKTPDFRLFEPDRRNWPASLPAVVDREAAAAVPAVGGRPVYVQEYVAHTAELRVYFLNDGICAFDVRMAEPASMWTDPDSVTVARTDCPPAAADVVRTLCSAWKLRYGAFDLLVTETGEAVFLEVNPDGDWLWYERKAQWHGVSFMAAVMVRELFVRCTS